MAQRKPDPPVGVLGPELPPELGGALRHERYLPAADLDEVVEHHWTVRWDLRGHPPLRRETLPHPSVHLVIQRGESRVGGPHTARWTGDLVDEGRVVAVKFRPAGFYALLREPVRRFADRTFPLRAIFGRAAAGLEREVLGEGDDGAVARLEQFLRARRPVVDDEVRLGNRVVAAIVAGDELRRVEEVAARFALSVRTLQRLFARVVGVSPKWVILRHRLHEAAAALGAGRAVELGHLAAELGYFDQAHFIKDWKAIVGVTPAEYVRRVETSPRLDRP